MTTTDPTRGALPPDNPALTPAFRWLANLLQLAALCGQAKCRRAYRCRGEPRMCLPRYAPLLPEEAIEGAKALIDGKMANRSFDEVRDESPEIEDLVDWRALVDGCRPRRKPVR